MSGCSGFGRGTPPHGRGAGSRGSCRGLRLFDDGCERTQVERPLYAKGPTECLAACRQIQAPGRGVKMRPSSRQRAARIGRHDDCRGLLNCDDSHQIGLVRALPATDARPDDLDQSTRLGKCSCHRSVSLGARRLGVGPDVDAPPGQLGGETGVLALLADRERQLEVGDDDAGRAGRLVDDRDRPHLRR